MSAQPNAKYDIECMLRDLIPARYWSDIVSAVVESIKLAHRLVPERWGIRVQQGNLMLLAGPHEILQITKGLEFPFHLIVDRTKIAAPLREKEALRFSGNLDWEGKPSKCGGYYASNPKTEACNMPFERVAETYHELHEAHDAIIAEAGRLNRLHPSTRKSHQPDLLRFLAAQTGAKLCQPSYVDETEAI